MSDKILPTVRHALILAIYFLLLTAFQYRVVEGDVLQATQESYSNAVQNLQVKQNQELPIPTNTPTPNIVKKDSNTSLIPVAKAQEVTPSVPIRVRMDIIGLNAPIIPEGKDARGEMGVPADNATVGWWKIGRKPGEIGSSVLVGHYKIDDGSPGVFFRLNEAKIGDQISIISENGLIQVFEITDRQIYDAADFPLKYVFTRKDSNRLNLITCSGRYLPELDDYSHRLVVFAELSTK